jgi:M-phase inducer tyrosine phosphatase
LCESSNYLSSAKHLRAKDRAANNHVYPKIFYPEVYVLEGGYCEYFRNSSSRCNPCAYIRMDDPKFAEASRQNMDQFRSKTKFSRHKSYAYGDIMGKPSSSSQQQLKRNTAPSGGPTTVFAAASAARSRRGGASLMTLTEDVQSTPEAGDDTDNETDLGDSPCPPPTKAVPTRGKKVARPLLRAETYGPARMPTLGGH